MRQENTQKKETTVLNRKKWFDRKIAAIMTAVALATGPALLMTGCDSSHDNDDTSYTDTVDNNVQVPQDIANLDNATKTGQLVQGRQGCIDKLVKNGLSNDEAGKVCDEIATEAKAQIAAQQQQQGTNQPSTVIVNNNNGGGSDALLWYWIGASSHQPYIYYGSPSSGLTLYHTSYNSSLKEAPPPAHFNNVQTTYLSTESAMRPAVMSQLAARPGVKVVAVSHFTHDGSHVVMTHVSSGSSISHGGFGGHGVSSAG